MTISPPPFACREQETQNSAYVPTSGSPPESPGGCWFWGSLLVSLSGPPPQWGRDGATERRLLHPRRRPGASCPGTCTFYHEIPDRSDAHPGDGRNPCRGGQ